MARVEPLRWSEPKQVFSFAQRRNRLERDASMEAAYATEASVLGSLVLGRRRPAEDHCSRGTGGHLPEAARFESSDCSGACPLAPGRDLEIRLHNLEAGLA